MFKLVKILGAKNSAPDIVECSIAPGTPVMPGHVFYVSYNNIGPDRPEHPTQRFVTMEKLESDHNKSKVKGFFITPGMVFEVTPYGTAAGLGIGEPVTFYRDNYSIFGVLETSDGDGITQAIIISKDNYSRTGTIQVVFV